MSRDYLQIKKLIRAGSMETYHLTLNITILIQRKLRDNKYGK